MKLILAPMEGLADFHLRQLITDFGGFDLVINEFLRVVDQLLPERVFYKNTPELKNGSKTRSGTPVRMQLLGNNVSAMVDNAHRALELGSFGIDVNFGCPSKTVNKSNGGAVLLKTPDTIHAILSEMRRQLPKDSVISAKIRMGFEQKDELTAISQAALSSDIDMLTIHARTKAQGYTPPVYWSDLLPVAQSSAIPIIANGDIFNSDAAALCQQESGASGLMLGRGAVWRPYLADMIKNRTLEPDWKEFFPTVLACFDQIAIDVSEKYAHARLKQWLKLAGNAHEQAAHGYQIIKTNKAWSESRKICELL